MATAIRRTRSTEAFFGRRHGKSLRPEPLAALAASLPRYRLDLTCPPPEPLAFLFSADLDNVRLEIGFAAPDNRTQKPLLWLRSLTTLHVEVDNPSALIKFLDWHTGLVETSRHCSRSDPPMSVALTKYPSFSRGISDEAGAESVNRQAPVQIRPPTT